jgi:hypothetical protein
MFGSALLASALACAGADPGGQPPQAGTGGRPASSGGAGGSSAGAGGAASTPPGPQGGSGGAGTPSAGGAGGAASAATGGSAGGASGGSGGAAAADAAEPAAGGSSGSDAAPRDSGPGTLPAGEKHVVVLYGANLGGDAQRASMRGVIEAMKQSHNVIYEEMVDRDTRAPMLMNKDLVIIGGHANFCEADQDMAFGDLPVPVIVSKDCDRTTRIFRMGTMHNTPNDQTKIHIANPMHPLAAGLTGDVTVFPSVSRIVNASDLGPKAVVIATTLAGGNPCIFYYDKGDAMLDGFVAPGKRMGFFWHRPTAGTEGAKKLLTAAIDWMLRK